MTFRTLRLHRNPACPVCGDHPTQTTLIDYDAFCGVAPAAANGHAHEGDVPEVTVTALKARLDRGEAPFILDVRKPHEYEIAQIGGVLIPVDDLAGRLTELEPFRHSEIIVHCRSGARSARAVKLLREQGFRGAVNLKGGILAWSDEVDPSVPKY